MATTKIYGAPGTGKTKTLLDVLENAIRGGNALRNIAFVTHSVAARDEARHRAKLLMPNAKDEDFRYFRTIHGIAYQAMHLGPANVMQPEDYIQFGDHACLPFSEAFTDELDEDGLPHGWVQSPGNRLLAVRQFAAAWMLDPFHPDVMSEWPDDINPSELKWALAKYESWKARESKFDFVDMLQVYLTDQCQPIDATVGIVDEAQDLSRLQWGVVDKMLSRSSSVYYAGDDDQSIYGFIGADPSGFLFKNADRDMVLPKSYRMRENIWRFSQGIISGVSQRRDKDIEVTPGGQVQFWNLDPNYLQIEGETMVIARHHAQLTDIAKDLHERGIPCVHRGQSVTGTERASAVMTYLRAKRGEMIWLKDAASLLRLAGHPKEAKRLREEARQHPENLIEPDRIGLDFTIPWRFLLSVNRHTAYVNDILDRIIEQHGINALMDKPKITLTTYHASKGREADNVVLFTDCYQAAWDHAMRHPDDERRLSYVGVTRARHNLTIVAPTEDTHMRMLA